MRKGFTFDGVLSAAARIAAQSASTLLFIAALDAFIQIASTLGIERAGLTDAPRGVVLWAVFFPAGTYMQQAGVAAIAARAEGRVSSPFHALLEARFTWARALSAAIRSALTCALAFLFFVVPGVWLAVRQLFSSVAVFRVRDDDPIEQSHQAVTGWFWQAFSVAALTFGVRTVIMLITLVLSTLSRDTPLALLFSSLARFLSSVCVHLLVHPLMYTTFVALQASHGRQLNPIPWNVVPPLDSRWIQRSQS